MGSGCNLLQSDVCILLCTALPYREWIVGSGVVWQGGTLHTCRQGASKDAYKKGGIGGA